MQLEVICRASIAIAFFFYSTSAYAQVNDVLPSWNDTNTKKAVIDFVLNTTDQNSSKYVPEDKRIAVFDNDGTLWCEQPAYFQLLFALDRIKALAPQHPEWNEKEPFLSAIKGDMKGLMASGEKGLLQIIAATHSGLTSESFDKIVRDWFKTAKHPTLKRPYSDLVYQPMIELLTYLRSNGFKTFIVSGGGIEFMRAFATEAYGIPPEQIVGSAGKLRYEVKDGKPVLTKLPELDFIDDKDGKPVGIQKFIGQQPILAFGNSDGDFQMLEWTTAGAGTRLAVLIHHTDSEREFAYDKDSHIGTLVKGLDEASKRGWLLVDMKNDWKLIFQENRKESLK